MTTTTPEIKMQRYLTIDCSSRKNVLIIALVLGMIGSIRGTVIVTTESNPTGDVNYTFATISPPSVNDYGTLAKVLIANTNTATGGNLNGDWRKGLSVYVIQDGTGAISSSDTDNNIVFGDPTLYGKILFDLTRLVTVTQINTYAWSNDDLRNRQAYCVFGSTATNAPPAGNTDNYDTLTANGWNLIATMPLFGGTDDQTASQITDSTGSLGQWRHLLFCMGDGIFGIQGGKTMYSEIDIYTDDANVLCLRAAQFNVGDVLPYPIASMSGDLLETSVASVTGENAAANPRNGTTGTAYENTTSNPALKLNQAVTTYYFDTSKARAGYDIRLR